MEHFFIGEDYCSDLGDLFDMLDLTEDKIEALPDDWEMKAYEASLEPVITLTADWIMDRIDEERFTEVGEEADKVYKLLEKLDFKSVNDKMPKLYYESRKSFLIKKAHLIEYIS